MMNSTAGILIGLFCVGLFVLAFGGGGAFLLYRTRKNKQQADASLGLPSAIGQIVEADVHHSRSTDSEGDSRDSYTPHVRYTYHANGADYTGDKITFGFVSGYGSESKARAGLMKYPIGGQVPVYYDPANPEKAVLERKAGGSTAGMIIGIALLVVAFCIGCPAAIAIPMGWFGTK
jgi:hypothetical protein